MYLSEFWSPHEIRNVYWSWMFLLKGFWKVFEVGQLHNMIQSFFFIYIFVKMCRYAKKTSPEHVKLPNFKNNFPKVFVTIIIVMQSNELSIEYAPKYYFWELLLPKIPWFWALYFKGRKIVQKMECTKIDVSSWVFVVRWWFEHMLDIKIYSFSKT